MPNKKDEEIENLNIEDADVRLEIENLDFDGEIKDVSAPSTNTGSEGISTTSSTNNEVVHSNDAVSSPMESVDNSSSSTASSDLSSTSSPVNTENSDAAIPTENNVPNTDMADFAGDRAPKESLKDKADRIRNAPENIRNNINDTKDRINNAKDRIKNAPDDIKNKVNDAKEKVKEVPDNLRKKRDAVKDKWDNRPKSMNEAKDRAKNGLKNAGKNFRDKAKQGAKNVANKAKDKAVDTAKESELGQKVQNVANKIEKAKKAQVKIKKLAVILKNPVVLGIIVGLLLVLVLVIMVPSMFASGSPLVGGEVQEEENYNKYSEVDQKTIDKLKKISEKYASGNPSYAMAATLYPYIDEMQNGNVNSLRGKTTKQQEDEEDVYDDDDNNSDKSDNEELEESKNDTISNDPYLELFRKRKYRKKFEKLLKISKDGDDALTEFLKKTWFKKDAGYKELFDGVKDESALADAIISDIQDQKDDFKGYFYDNCSTSYSSQSAGSVDFDDMLKGNILVDVKVSSCTTGKDVWDCESMYDTPIDMAKYTKGVTYEEIGVSGSSDVEKVKAQIVAAKSYVIGRSKSMGWGVRKDDAGNYIITIRANTNDQDYCDIDVGCKSGKTIVREGSAKRNAVDANTRAKLDEAWEATKNVYIQSSNGSLKGEFCNSRSGVCDFCTKGSCMAHQELEKYESASYDKILIDQYSSYALVTIEGNFASAMVGVANTTCSTTNDSSNFIYYAQNDYANTAFCGRSLSAGKNGCTNGDSICTSGCGVTSAAMAVATLTQNKSITPETINSSARVGTDCGSNGTTGSLFPYVSSNNGLEAKSISTKEDIISTLDSGGLVIANVDGVFGDGIYKTGGGHYVVVRGYSGDNVYIADPWQNQSMIKHCEEFNSSNHCTKLSTDFDTFVSNVKNHGAAGFYAITGGISFSESGSSGASQGTGKTTGYLTSPFGKNETNSQAKNHLNGNSSTLYYNSGGYHGAIDFAVASGTNVYAMDGGEVVTAHNDTGNAYGKYIIIKLSTSKKTYYNLYAHLSSIKVKEGEKVSQGQLIAKSGNTGTNTTGAHLHAELINSTNCLGHTCRGTHYNVLKYIGTKKTYVGQKCDGKGC